jgi:hypothetical protein
MSRDLEQDLRQALRPVDPSAELTSKLLAAIPTKHPATTRSVRPWLRQMAVAASILLALGLSWGTYQRQQQERASQAHAELLKALAITNRSLDHVYRAVQSLDADRGHGG